jgi:hypothetical protein
MSDSAENLTLGKTLAILLGSNHQYEDARSFHSPEVLVRRLGLFLGVFEDQKSLIEMGFAVTTLIGVLNGQYHWADQQCRVQALTALSIQENLLLTIFKQTLIAGLLQEALANADAEGLYDLI